MSDERTMEFSDALQPELPKPSGEGPRTRHVAMKVEFWILPEEQLGRSVAILSVPSTHEITIPPDTGRIEKRKHNTCIMFPVFNRRDGRTLTGVLFIQEKPRVVRVYPVYESRRVADLINFLVGEV